MISSTCAATGSYWEPAIVTGKQDLHPWFFTAWTSLDSSSQFVTNDYPKVYTTWRFETGIAGTRHWGCPCWWHLGSWTRGAQEEKRYVSTFPVSPSHWALYYLYHFHVTICPSQRCSKVEAISFLVLIHTLSITSGCSTAWILGQTSSNIQQKWQIAGAEYPPVS